MTGGDRDIDHARAPMCDINKELSGSPKFLPFPCSIIPRPQTPIEQSIAHHIATNRVVFEHMKTLDLYDVGYYGAQYLHAYALRSDTSERLCFTCFVTAAGATVRAGRVVNPYPDRTLTGKKRQASLGALMTLLLRNNMKCPLQ